MATRGKSINIFLMDGEPTGRIKCTLANWTGVAYKIPRTALDLCKERDDLKQSGIYFLFGTSDQTGNNVVYVGQAGARKNGEGCYHGFARAKPIRQLTGRRRLCSPHRITPSDRRR